MQQGTYLLTVVLTSNREQTVMADVWFTPTEAASACGVDVTTIRRWISKDAIPGARRRGIEKWQQWLIPLDGLVQRGYCDASARPTSWTAKSAPNDAAGDSAKRIEGYERRITELEALVDRLEAHCDRQQRMLDQLLARQAA